MSYSPFPAAYTTTGSATPSSTLQVGGSDGTDLRVLLTSTTGQVHVLADNQPSFAFDSASNLLVNTQGYDGAQFHSLRTDQEGRLRVIIDAAPDEEDTNDDGPAWDLYDPEVNQAVATPGSPRQPNFIQVVQQSSGPQLLVSPATDARVQTNVSEPGGLGGTTASPFGLYTPFLKSGTSPGSSSNNPLRFVASQAARCAMVNVRNYATSNVLGATGGWSLRVRNLTNGAQTGWQPQVELSIYEGPKIGPSTATVYCNLPISAGDVMQVELAGAFPSGSPVIAACVTLLSEVVPVPLRSDGRGLPVGSTNVTGSFANAAAVISAPTTPFSILLYSVSFSASASSASASASGTVGGGGGALIANAASGAMVWPQGLLLDQNAALSAISSTGNATISAQYDIVPGA